MLIQNTTNCSIANTFIPHYAVGSIQATYSLTLYAHYLRQRSIGTRIVRGSNSKNHKHQLVARFLSNLNISEVFLHEDHFATTLTSHLGAHAVCYSNHIFLGDTVDTLHGPSLENTLRHELIHVAQIKNYCSTNGRLSSIEDIEQEADALSGYPSADQIKHCASPGQFYGLWWLLPLAAAAYVALRPNIANAPGPDDKVYESVSELQIAGEAMALFYLPSLTYQIAGRIGLGALSSSAVSGATATTSFRAVGDVSQGEYSGTKAYVYDAATGAILGYVIPGGIQLIGKGAAVPLDWLATHGMRRSDLQLTKIIAERAATNPLSPQELTAILNSRGPSGRVAEWWLNRRGHVLLYRGQAVETSQILSPLARQQGIKASEALVAEMKASGLTDAEIASYTASWYTQPVPKQFTLPQLANKPLGAVGIPSTRIPGIASNFGDAGVVYVIKLPNNAAIKVPHWGLAAENEWVILNQVPKGSIIRRMPASRIPSLTLDDAGHIIPGN